MKPKTVHITAEPAQQDVSQTQVRTEGELHLPAAGQAGDGLLPHLLIETDALQHLLCLLRLDAHACHANGIFEVQCSGAAQSKYLQPVSSPMHFYVL